jgi:UPF0489 domain
MRQSNIPRSGLCESILAIQPQESSLVPETDNDDHLPQSRLRCFFERCCAFNSGSERRDPAYYKPWTEAEIRAFLEKQCHLNTSHRIPGRFVVLHDEAFDFWKELVAKHRTQIDLVHVDAHADLGLGDASWLNIITQVLHLPVEQRADPLRGSRNLNPGSYVAYALAARWIASMIYVHHPHFGNDIPRMYFENNDPSVSGRLQLKAYSKDFKPGLDYPPAVNKATSFEPIVPLKQVPIAQFEADKPFQYALLAQSPGFTPPTSDALIAVFRDYIDFES